MSNPLLNVHLKLVSNNNQITNESFQVDEVTDSKIWSYYLAFAMNIITHREMEKFIWALIIKVLGDKVNNIKAIAAKFNDDSLVTRLLNFSCIKFNTDTYTYCPSDNYIDYIGPGLNAY